ncbi:hypothetical protein [Labedaea rhizosphaerae]|uniref:Uncharacterized protein n=1 Tax=Labedaea rhizosphaerae TaxID=598644 RepID=A0A4R6SHZ1_LABRH|nr:hypothetical protein [Labedaea rhizosphaerae]TDQ01263.1 hypothetical protein EV186_1021131 [Labedaea rhizosphaerae]
MVEDDGPLVKTMSALDGLAAAVRDDQPSQYREALARARSLGCTAEQIIDAYQWGQRLRWRSEPVSFDQEGRTDGD